MLRLAPLLCRLPALGLLAAVGLACAAARGAPVAAAGPALRLPERAAEAAGGSRFADRVSGLPLEERARAVLAEVRAGNVPGFLRTLRPVQVEHRLEGGRTLRATVFVTPDYLAIGSNADFLRMPMNLFTATEAARAAGAVLPTRKLVDAIHAQADVRLRPKTLPPGPLMRTIGAYRRHNHTVQLQLGGRPLGALVSGHKKDVVLTNRLTPARRKVAIYGWFEALGRAIQPLSTVHVAPYADYSHGVRLVSETVLVDGEPRSIYELFGDPELGYLLSYEGPIPAARALMGDPAAS